MFPVRTSIIKNQRQTAVSPVPSFTVGNTNGATKCANPYGTSINLRVARERLYVKTRI